MYSFIKSRIKIRVILVKIILKIKSGIRGLGIGDWGLGIGDMPSLGGFALPNYKRRGKKSNEFNIAPSFTGIVENIKMTAPLKVSSSFGVTPFQSRGLFVGKRSKKERYFQLTDL